MSPLDRKPISIWMVDDDPDDRMLAQDAFDECRIANPLEILEDGDALLKRLSTTMHLPDLILLDLNMPRKSGLEALTEIKADLRLRHIPIIVLTTSDSDDDVAAAYQLGASSYITKPVTFDGLVEVMRTIKSYWLEIVAMPRTLAEAA